MFLVAHRDPLVLIALALETATDICSVAVARDGEVIGRATADSVHQHASRLTILISEALSEAQVNLSEVNRLILSDGPGSYTSLRVGAATAKGLCLAMPGLAFSVVPTLVSLAAACSGEGVDRILAVLDSRRDEVFGQVFAAADLAPASEVMNIRLTDPQWRGRLLGGAGLGRIAVCGPGQERLREALDPGDNAFSFASPGRALAEQLLAAGALTYAREPDIAVYEPFYRNAPFVTKSKKRGL